MKLTCISPIHPTAVSIRCGAEGWLRVTRSKCWIHERILLPLGFLFLPLEFLLLPHGDGALRASDHLPGRVAALHVLGVESGITERDGGLACDMKTVGAEHDRESALCSSPTSSRSRSRSRQTGSGGASQPSERYPCPIAPAAHGAETRSSSGCSA